MMADNNEDKAGKAQTSDLKINEPEENSVSTGGGSKTLIRIVMILFALLVLAGLGYAAYYFLMPKTNDQGDGVKTTTTPTVTATVFIDDEETTTVIDKNTDDEPSEMTKTVKLDKYNTTIDIPSNWKLYPYTDPERPGLGVANYWIIDEASNTVARIGSISGDELDYFCFEGTVTTEKATVAGKSETYAKCTQDGRVTGAQLNITKYDAWFTSNGSDRTKLVLMSIK